MKIDPKHDTAWHQRYIEANQGGAPAAAAAAYLLKRQMDAAQNTRYAAAPGQADGRIIDAQFEVIK